MPGSDTMTSHTSSAGVRESGAAPRTRRDSRFRLGYCGAGIGLLVLYAGAARTQGFGMSAIYGLDYIAPSEFMFWMAHLTLATPGVLLVGYGMAPRLAAPLSVMFRQARSTMETRPRLASAAYFLLLLALAVLGRWVVLLNQPITDDENSVLFGARMIGEGFLKVPTPQPEGAFHLPFTYRRDGYVMSMDFPGVLFFAAASLLTGLGSLLYAVVAAGTGVAVVHAARLLGGRPASMVAALLWLLSPMVLTLSMTTHAHLVSRALLALAVVAYARLFGSEEPAPSPHAGALLGLFAGLGFLCRPVEIGLILLPVAVHLLWSCYKAPRHWGTTGLVAAAGLAVPLALFAWYNVETTGVWYLQARLVPGVMDPTSDFVRSPWERVGANFGLTLILLAVFLLGPLGLAATVPAAARGPAAVRVLLSGVLVALSLTLLHDNVGIHTVGPIHYSECAVPLVLIAAIGLARVFERLAQLELALGTPALLLAFYLVGGLGLFTLTHARSLRYQAENQRLPFAALEDAGVHNAVVLAQRPFVLYWNRADLARWGSWVLHFPLPHPFLRDDVIFVRSDSNLSELRRRFPDRRFYRLVYEQSGKPVIVLPVEPDRRAGG